MSTNIGLYLGVQPSAGGMFQYAQCILKSLAEIERYHKFNVVVAYGDSRWKPLLDNLDLNGVHLRHWRSGTLMARILMGTFCPPKVAKILSRFLNPLVKELRKLDCGIWIFPAQDELSWQIDAIVISTIHDLMHRYERRFSEAGNWWRYLMREHRFQNISKRSHAILVDSDLGRQHVIESYGVTGEQIYPLRYIAPTYIQETHERPDFNNHFRLPEKFYFYPAQFWPHKNHLRLIQALFESRAICPDMNLVFSGGKTLEYELVKDLVFELGLENSVHFLGYVQDEDMASIYKRARALVMPTFFGPTNIPPLEAMAVGCPALLSRIYAMEEQSGDAALYFDPSSVEEMRGQMIRLWQDDALRDQLVARGLVRAKEWGQMQFDQRLAEIIENVFLSATRDSNCHA